MKLTKIQLPSLVSLRRNKINLFYISALAPLTIIFLINPFNVIIPFYGFLLLFLKSQKLSEIEGTSPVQKILGTLVIAVSFFVYYAVVLVYPKAASYGAANYVVYLFGLLMIFFKLSALKESFAPLFLIVAATSSAFISVWLKPSLSPFTNDFAHIIVSVLRALGVNAYIYYLGGTPIISLSSLSGGVVSGSFVYECIGVYSVLVFSIILIVILFEDASCLKVKLAYSIVGLLGTLALNIFRVTMIFLTDYFYGVEAGANVHNLIGYALFSTWLACFFYVYAKRQALHAKIISFWKKIR